MFGEGFSEPVHLAWCRFGHNEIERNEDFLFHWYNAYGVVILPVLVVVISLTMHGQSKGSSDISSSSDEDHCSSISNIISSRTTTTNEDDCSSSRLS